MRWQAQIQDAKAGSKNISLGHYASPEAAGRAYDMAAICLRVCLLETFLFTGPVS